MIKSKYDSFITLLVGLLVFSCATNVINMVLNELYLAYWALFGIVKKKSRFISVCKKNIFYPSLQFKDLDQSTSYTAFRG